jgi:hypothetical protein
MILADYWNRIVRSTNSGGPDWISGTLQHGVSIPWKGKEVWFFLDAALLLTVYTESSHTNEQGKRHGEYWKCILERTINTRHGKAERSGGGGGSRI